MYDTMFLRYNIAVRILLKWLRVNRMSQVVRGKFTDLNSMVRNQTAYYTQLIESQHNNILKQTILLRNNSY